MTLYYGKYMSLSIGARNGAGREIRNLHITFDIVKNTEKAANECKLKVYNMLIDTYNDLKNAKDLQIIIDAGYTDLHNVLFVGDVATMNWSKQGVDTVVDITAFDGQYALQNAVMSKSYAPGTLVRTVVEDCKKVLKGLGITVDKEFSEFSKKAYNKTLYNTMKNGLTEQDRVINILIRLLQPYNYKVYIQDKALIIAPKKWKITQSTRTTVSFGPNTGLIGTPVIKSNGTKEINTVLNPSLKVGDIIEVDCETLKGYFTISELGINGSNFEDDWKCKMELV